MSPAFVVEYAEIDDDDRVIGPWRVLLKRDHTFNVTRAQRFTDYINVTEGRYAARARNANPKYEGDNYTPYDTVTWDGLRAHLDREPLRPWRDRARDADPLGQGDRHHLGLFEP